MPTPARDHLKPQKRQIGVCVTDEERDKLVAASRTLGMSLSAFVVAAAVDQADRTLEVMPALAGSRQ
jgi:uncharacterized protein (DUF1778 family)